MKRAKWSLADVRARMLNTPLMVSEERARIALGVMGPRLNIGALIASESDERVPVEALSAQARRARAEMESMPGDAELRPMTYVDGMGWVERDPYEIWNGVAIIHVRGTLFAENGLDPYSGATGYDGLSYKFRHAAANDQVRGAALDIDSGGGEVIDLLETCRQARLFAETKPLRSIVRGTACSAAYALAACAGPGNVTAADYSVVGSIGAIMMHADFSKHLEQEGIDVTMIKSAEHKDDGSPYKALAPDVAASLQAMVASCADSFIDHVVDARGMDRDGVVAQQARFYSGQQALDLGLVDKFMAWDESIKEFAASLNGMARRPAAASPGRGGLGASSTRETKMDTIESALAAIVADSTDTNIRAALTALHTAGVAAGKAEGETAGAAAGAAAERERITALAELDGQSTVSEGLAAAIEAGTSAGDYAISLQKAAKTAGPDALARAKADAANANELPAASGNQPGKGETNRGKALIEKQKALANRG